jgi:hypothetical protein
MQAVGGLVTAGGTSAAFIGARKAPIRKSEAISGPVHRGSACRTIGNFFLISAAAARATSAPRTIVGSDQLAADSVSNVRRLRRAAWFPEISDGETVAEAEGGRQPTPSRRGLCRRRKMSVLMVYSSESLILRDGNNGMGFRSRPDRSSRSATNRLGSHNGFAPSSKMTASKLPPRRRRLTLQTQ